MRWTVSAAVVVSVLLAGCGGRNEKAAPRARFVVAADAICSRFPRPLRQAELGASGTTLASAESRFAERVAAGVERLQRLRLPGGRDHAGAEAFVESLTAVASAAARLKTATLRLAAHDPTDTDGIGRVIEQTPRSLPRQTHPSWTSGSHAAFHLRDAESSARASASRSGPAVWRAT